MAMELIHQRVKFSANVVPYYKINRNNNLFVQIMELSVKVG